MPNWGKCGSTEVSGTVLTMDSSKDWFDMLPHWVRGDLSARTMDTRPAPGPYLVPPLSSGETHDRLFNGLMRRLERYSKNYRVRVYMPL